MNVKIEKLVYGGEGLGHSEGNTVFVSFVIPGEEVAVRPVERKKKFVRAALQQVTKPSAERIPAECPHFSECGGCHYQHIPYEKQPGYKTQILRETLARLGRVQWEGEIRAHASPAFAYRNRAQWKVRWVNDGTQSRGLIGYNRSGSSAVLPIEQCPILAPELQTAFLGLREAIAANQFPNSLREIEVFGGTHGGELMLNASFAGMDKPAKLFQLFREIVPNATSILLHDSHKDAFELDGPGFVTYQAAGQDYRVGHLSFFQVNRFLVDAMVAAVTGGHSGDSALDLFAGVGLFSLPLAKQFARVTAVESNEAAVRDLSHNATAAGAKIQAVAQDVEKFLTHCKEQPDLVVLDPPRAGLGPNIIKHLRRLAAPEVGYLSCDPSTLARDLAGLLDKDAPGAAYQVTDVQLFDVFPQTFHIESLVQLKRV